MVMTIGKLNANFDLLNVFKQTFASALMNAIPGIMIDVDGVLKLGRTPIPKAKEAIELLRQKQIPFILITNGGGEPEAYKAKVYSSILRLKPSCELLPLEIVLCHTPMQSNLKIMSDSFSISNKLPLISGCGDIDSLMKSYGITNYITHIEYSIIHSHIMSFNCISPFLPQKQSILKKVEHRLNKKFNPKQLISISSIFQINDVLDWEIPIQLSCDLLISKDGIPGSLRDKHSSNNVEYHLGCEEIEYVDVFKTPRICGGSYFYSLKSLFSLLYQMSFSHILYGKPSKVVFEFAKKRLSEMNQGKTIKNYYMIGDTLLTDIKGANENGIHSILVRTGMFKGVNCSTNQSKTVVDNVYEAIQYIIHKERL